MVKVNVLFIVNSLFLTIIETNSGVEVTLFTDHSDRIFKKEKTQLSSLRATKVCRKHAPLIIKTYR